MNRLRESGFTIIETMLFLGVTGLLIAGIMIGSGTAISMQRYRDSVSSFQLELQQLYSDVVNVYNERDGTQSCVGGGVNTGAPGPRGQSECVILGKYVTINDDTMRTVDVLGYSTSDSMTGSDLQVLRQYTLATHQASAQETSMPWGTRLAWPATGSGSKSPTVPRTLAVLVVRSPISGFVYTFTRDTLGTPTNTYLRGMIVESGSSDIRGRDERILCVNPNGLITGSNMSVVINRHASNGNAIETRSNEWLQQMGRDTRC